MKKKLTRDQFAAEVMRRVRGAGEKADLTFDRSAFCIMRDGERYLYLHNAYDEYRAAPARLRETTLRHWAQAWFACQEKPPETYDEAKRGLLPIVRSRATCEYGLEQDACRLLGEHHTISLVHDRPLTMTHLKAKTLAKWSVTFEEALAAAMENLRSISFPPRFVPHGKGLFRSGYGDQYDASRILLPELFLERRLHGDPVAIVPNEHTLLLAGADDEEGLAAMADLAWDCAQKPRFLSRIPLRLRGSTWEAYVPPPDHPAFVPFRNLWQTSMSCDYAQQKAAIDERNKREGRDVFVAEYMTMPLPGRRELASGCVWADGVTSLLPRSDLIALLPSGCQKAVMDGTASLDDAGMVLAPWERVLEFAEDMLVQIDVYPPRYQVDRFPARDRLDGLRRSLEAGPCPKGVSDPGELRKPSLAAIQGTIAVLNEDQREEEQQ